MLLLVFGGSVQGVMCRCCFIFLNQGVMFFVLWFLILQIWVQCCRVGFGVWKLLVQLIRVVLFIVWFWRMVMVLFLFIWLMFFWYSLGQVLVFCILKLLLVFSGFFFISSIFRLVVLRIFVVVLLLVLVLIMIMLVFSFRLLFRCELLQVFQLWVRFLVNRLGIGMNVFLGQVVLGFLYCFGGGLSDFWWFGVVIMGLCFGMGVLGYYCQLYQ